MGAHAPCPFPRAAPVDDRDKQTAVTYGADGFVSSSRAVTRTIQRLGVLWESLPTVYQTHCLSISMLLQMRHRQ
jgi:hypothetical protein